MSDWEVPEADARQNAKTSKQTLPADGDVLEYQKILFHVDKRRPLWDLDNQTAVSGRGMTHRSALRATLMIARDIVNTHPFDATGAALVVQRIEDFRVLSRSQRFGVQGSMRRSPYHGHRFPPAIRHAVWLYLRFTLSLRDIEDLLAERGLDISYETVRRWVTKFGPLFARELRKRRPRPTGRWHLDEMAIRIAGKRCWLWRAVDDEGEVLDILVQSRRDKAAAVRLLRKLIRKQGFAPETITTDKLGSYGAAIRQLRLSARHDRGCVETTGPRTRISRPAVGNGRCKGSSRRDRPSASYRPMPPSKTPSIPSVIFSPAKP